MECVDEDSDIIGYCVIIYLIGSKICIIGCIEECLVDYGCSVVINIDGSDVLFLCLLELDVLCFFCSVDDDCIFVDVWCINIMLEDGLMDLCCVVDCNLDSDCNDGYECKVIGDENFVCVFVINSCFCIGLESILVVLELCVNKNVYGICIGM